DEDRMRAAAYTAEKQRTAARAAAEHDPALLREHLRSLELVCSIRRVGDADVARTAQLTQKTNQFNLSTIRRSEADIEAMRRDPAWRLYALDVHDRFGEYGTTGLVFAQRTADDAWHLDTVLLSCRVLGRGVESAFLRAVTRDLVAAGARRLTSKLVPTKKNAPVREFLPQHGFSAIAGDAEGWIKEPLPGPAFDDDHITIRADGLAT
ncbi:MAG TPA: hypothetical protein VLX92_07070, partial [Kofleriaceae bacterium]|nr:hypothetical protein [Kofleriaceae bacterium]